MRSTPRPVSAPSGDWRRGTQRDDVHFDPSLGTLSRVPRSQHAVPASPQENGSLHPPSRNLAPRPSVPDQTVQRNPTVTETRQPSSALPHVLPGPPDLEDPWKRKMLLTFDGGGVKGYSSLLILQAIMVAIAQIEQDQPVAPSSSSPLEPPASQNGHVTNSTSHGSTKKAPLIGPTSPSAVYLPCHYFDYMVGTSTGGLIAIMLSRLRMNVDDCIMEYETLGKEVFGRPRTGHIRSFLWWPRDKYDHRNLERVIEDVVKRRDRTKAAIVTFTANEEMCRTIVVAWQKLFLNGVRAPYLFRSYRHIKGPEDDNALERNADHNDNYPIWQVARATSAAPFYFKSVKIGRGNDQFEFVDGGFGANNPSVEAYREVRIMHSDTAFGALMSIGTGKDTESKLLRGSGLQMYYAYVNIAKKWATDSEDKHETMLTLTRMNRVPYFRLNVERGIGSMKLDEFKIKGDRNVTLEKIRKATEDYLSTKEVKNQIRECARLLVERRRRRAHDRHLDRWERFCFGVEYCCRIPECTDGNGTVYDTRDLLRQHLQDTHQVTIANGPDGLNLNDWLDRGKFYSR